MIEVQKIADFLNTELNDIGNAQGYSFDIKAEIGERTNQDAIYGIVTTTKADARVDENVDYQFTVELSVPSAKTNENIIKVEKIIGDFKNKFHMKNRAFGGGQGTLSISLATPKDYQIKYVIGDDVPVVFTIATNYIRNGVGSGDKHWFLNEIEIPFIKENLLVEKNGRVNVIHGKSYTETLLTQQTRYYKFNFDYDNTELCTMLKKDLLNGKYDKVYTLKYYDGIAFTKEEPFVSNVSIFRNGVSGSTKPNESEFDITFTDVDNEEEAEYYMALIDNPFDSTTENTRYFKTQEEQREYYQDKIDKDIRFNNGVGCMFVKIKAPNLSSIDITNQVYEIKLIKDEPVYDVISVANKNYAIIKVVKGEKEQWFYYFVTNQNIGGQNQVMFDLKLDSIQTYYFNPKLKFGDCLIEKGHLNRWIDNEDGTVSFDGTVDSKLFEREDIQNVSKRLTKRTKVGSHYAEQFPNLSSAKAQKLADWLNTYIKGWVYVYCVPQGTILSGESITKYNVLNIKGEQKSIGFPETKVVSHDNELSYIYNIPTNISVLCYPIMNFKSSIKFNTILDTQSYTVFWGERNTSSLSYENEPTILSKFADMNSGYLKFLSVQFSFISPLGIISKLNDDNVSIIGNELTINTETKKDNQFGYTIDNIMLSNNITINWAGNMFQTDAEVGLGRALAYLQEIDGDKLIGNYEVSKDYKFNIDEIINSKKNVKFNPKLLSTDYFELSISDSTGNGFVYDAQKLNMKEFQLRISDPLMPGISKTYIRINEPDGVYIKETQNNLTGFVNSNESSIAMPTSAYQSMIAQNKNFFLQNSINRGMDVARGLVGVGSSLGQSGISAQNSKHPEAVMQSGIVSGIQAVVGTGLNYAQSRISENLTVDNLKNAPASVVQAKGDILFESTYSDLGAFVEEYDILPNEKEIINDYMCKYGFTVNRFGNPKDYDNIRYYYNYVKAQIDSISGVAISNAARDDIRQRFANGIRFWNDDDVNYDNENYEEWLTKPTIIEWTVSPANEYVVAEYENKEFKNKFRAEADGICYLKCSEDKIISDYKIETDGVYDILLKHNFNKLEVSYGDATYVKIHVTVSEY